MDTLPVYSSAFRQRRMQNWIFLGLMYGFFYMSRYNLSAISTVLGQKFGWTESDYGFITGAALMTYGIAVFLNGPLSDRIGGKRTILIGAGGAAVFNFLFGLMHLIMQKPAVWNGTQLVSKPEWTSWMGNSTAIAMFTVLWALNYYFQSFGALSIVKINAAWFHRRERGRFAGIFGIMIQGGRQLAFLLSPLIVRFLPWQYAFWIPSAALVVMWFLCNRLVESTPKDAQLSELETGDETAQEALQEPTLGFILKKIFARPAPWIIGLTSMCIGMVRHAIDHWYPTYLVQVFNIKRQNLAFFKPYVFLGIAMPFAAVIGGLVAGFASDHLFKSRRAPVICLALIGQALCLLLLRGTLHHAWLAAIALVLILFFIQSAHSMVGGASSMDFGGRKAVATAAGLFDGAQYLGGALISFFLGRLLDKHKIVESAGVQFNIWPLVPIPFAILGAILIATLWNTVPGKKSAH